MRRLACLTAFLTRLPAPCSSIEDAARGFPLVPLVGLLEGLIVAAAVAAAPRPLPAAAAATLLHLAVTGGIHLDGFADYSDVLGAGAAGEAAERIIKDPRRGGFAVSYTAALLAARLAALASLAARPWAVASAYVAASEAMYAAARLMPARGSGLGALFAREGRRDAVNIVALAAVGLLLAAAGGPQVAAVALAAGLLVAVAVGRDASRRLGRASGDALGFAYEAALTLAMLAEGWLLG